MSGFVLVGIGGALGAMARHGLGMLVGRIAGHGFPYATLMANIIGSLAMGLLIGYLARFTPAWSNEARLLLGVGLLGGFTTFSSFSLDAISLFERGQMMAFVAYVLISVVAALGALMLGLMLMRGAA